MAYTYVYTSQPYIDNKIYCHKALVVSSFSKIDALNIKKNLKGQWSIFRKALMNYTETYSGFNGQLKDHQHLNVFNNFVPSYAYV